MSRATTGHLSTEALLDYWLGDSDPARTDAVDEHLLQCGACGEALDELIALGSGVRRAFAAGAVPAAASDAFVRRLAAQGRRIREYRVPANGSVNCTVAPDDELLVSRLEAPLQGVQRLDATTRLSVGGDVRREELHDIPFDPGAEEVLLLAPIARIRQLPAHTFQVTLVAVESTGRRELGSYDFHHRPWPGW